MRQSAVYVNKVLRTQVLQIQLVIYRNNKVEFMKILKSNIVLSAIVSATTMFATAAQAANDKDLTTSL